MYKRAKTEAEETEIFDYTKQRLRSSLFIYLIVMVCHSGWGLGGAVTVAEV